MGLFKPAGNTMAYFKAGFMGEAGSGKTHTASLVTIGLVQHLRKLGVPGSEKPVFMLDTEQGSAWVKPMFDEAGIELMVAKTRTFMDLVPAIKEAEANASAMFIDSVTHFWEELQSAYMAQRSRQLKRPYTRLEFQDWAILKSQWRQFSDIYVNSNLHCILCGRLGFEYDQTTDERTGKKQIEKSGVKMQAEKGLGYEPNILVWMERDMDLAEKSVSRTAIILKDRSQRLDGEQYPNPTFKTFLPHIDFLAIGGTHEGVDTSRTSEDIIPDDDIPLSERRSIKREIVIEELDALLAQHGFGGTSNEAKTKRAELVKKHFKATSRTEIEKLMPLHDLEANFDALHRELTGQPSRYGVLDAPAAVNDEIPTFDFPGDRPMPSDALKNDAELADRKPRVRVPAGTAKRQPAEAAE